MIAARPTVSPEVAQLIRQAVAASSSGDKARSHALFRAVTQLDQNNEAAWMWFANTAQDPQDAVQGLRSALRLNPKNPAAIKALPMSLLRAGVAAAKASKRSEAAELLADATAADPENATAWLWRAGVTDEPPRAIEYLERVLRLEPDNAQAKRGIEKLKPRSTEVWHCPLCDYTPGVDDTVSDICRRCRAVVAIRDPASFQAASQHVDRKEVESSLKRLRSKRAVAPSPENSFAIGLACLNLGSIEEGLQAMQMAVAGQSPNPGWKVAVSKLVQYFQARANRVPDRMSEVTQAPAEPPRVMVVDDSSTVRRMVTSVLTRSGYRVTEATDAGHAASLVREFGAPKLFILDVNMPGTDGFGLCKHFRADAETAGVPVVFLTGKTGLLNKIHGRWVGAAEYLTKPFEPEKLIATVSRLVPVAPPN